MRATIALAVALFTSAVRPVDSASAKDAHASTDTPLPLFIELKPDADDKVRIDVVRPKNGSRHQTEVKILVMKPRANPPAAAVRKIFVDDPEDYVAMNQSLLRGCRPASCRRAAQEREIADASF